MKRYIEDMELVRQTGKFYGNGSKMQVLVLEMINKTPSADVEEVVRCKDCQYHVREQEACHGKTEHYCNKLHTEVTSDFYCGHGRRKEEKNV